MSKIQVRIRWVDDERGWMAMPIVFTTKDLSEEKKTGLLANLEAWAQSEYVNIIRWNIAGDLQGHYILNHNFMNEEK